MTRLAAAVLALAVLALLPAAPARAEERPTLVIGSPTFQPLPIAVADFAGEGDARAAARET